MSESGAAWRPQASLQALYRRAERLAIIRAFFAERAVTEVETPLLAAAGVTDPAIESWQIESSGYWLQTSPEYAMKRLLAAGMGDCYQITRAFRAHEQGRHHNPEFSLLEWYRCGFDAPRLMAEVSVLIEQLLGPKTTETWRYADAFVHAGLPDPLNADQAELAAIARANGGAPAIDSLDRDGLLDWLFSVCVQPTLPERCFITHYPASQAVLARLDPGDSRVALRFELFCQGVEIANGFDELSEASTQRERFLSDQAQRQARGQVIPAIDERLLSALEYGLPDVAGVALGLDRLLMLADGASAIEAVIAFPWARA